MALELKNVSLSQRGEVYLSDIQLRLEAGSFNVLLGRTLAGKTSLMRVIAGLDRPNAGSVMLNGRDFTRVSVQQRNISMVYQQFINYPNLTVFENIASPLRIAGESSVRLREKVEATAELLHIEDLLDRMPLELSGGQQQRTAMARALVKDSDLILFDEPLVNLDYKLREELREELRELFRARNCIAIYATTEPTEAMALGGTTTLLHEGRVLQSGPAAMVYRQPARIEAAQLFSEPPMNILAGDLDAEFIRLDLGVELKRPRHFDLPQGQYRFGLRPHHVRLSASQPSDVALHAKVDVAELSGSETYLHMSRGAIEFTAQLAGVRDFRTDTETPVYFSAEQFYVFDQQGQTVATPLEIDTGRAIA